MCKVSAGQATYICSTRITKIPGSNVAFRSGSITSTKLIHQSKDAFAYLKQLLPRLRNRSLRQKLLRRDRFQSSLGFVQMGPARASGEQQ